MNDLAFHVERAKDWLANACTGEFSGYVLGKELSIEPPDLREQVLADLRSLGLIEPVGGKHGIYTVVRSDCPRIDWQTVTADWYPLWLPFGLSKMCGVRPKNVVIIAGEMNAGKTWFVLKAAHENLKQNGGKHEHIKYFNSEMAGDELRARLLGIDNSPNAWAGFDARERNRDFHAVIQPDGLNIIDFLEISGEFYRVGEYIQRIHERLSTGIAIICLQKAQGKDTGHGGNFTLEKARLALALSYCHGVSTCKIIKSKNPLVGSMNPQAQEIDYRLQNGSVAVPIHPGWRWVSEKERKDITMAAEQAQIASRYSQKWAEYEVE